MFPKPFWHLGGFFGMNVYKSELLRGKKYEILHTDSIRGFFQIHMFFFKKKSWCS